MAKAQTPQPIDRPLSKAYLREFTGWSTAYPPGMSEPTSLRLMENLVIGMDGGAKIRPALRSVLETDEWLDSTHGVTAVGAFEPFFLNNGGKALLFAAREPNGRVGFRVAVYLESTGKYTVFPGDDPSYGFEMEQGFDTVAFDEGTVYVRYVQIDNKIFALSTTAPGSPPESMRVFWVGSDKHARRITAIEEPSDSNSDRLTVRLPDDAWIAGDQSTIPAAETLTTSTLISTNSADNDYNFAYWYTFNNEIGESAPGRITVVKAQRRWTAWIASPSDDTKSEDQLVAIIPVAVWDNAKVQGAVSWNLYMLTWSDQDSVPVEGILLKTTTMQGGVGRESHGWAAHTPLLESQEATMPLPGPATRVNYTEPSHASQGLVAGDRLILVNDKEDAAVIRWSSNQQGNYTNFSASVGGGYKTLTSGNLFVPSAVKLWQNPQSTDTITILCDGVDGYATSYYMQPASVSGASSNVTIMGFEETTATPGTVSPFGCEVLNNALYHPLDTQLMKSTASNYNISHRPMTDTIQNKWLELRNKDRIVSSQYDNKLYFIVDNPDGVDVPDGCNGNEIWVCDTENEGTWSRWLVPAVSLHKLELKGKLYMAVVLPDTIAVFDELQTLDTVNSSGTTLQRAIPWRLETNTQGANRAHDAWCRLQQALITVGNFHGSMRYGIRGHDTEGRMVDKSKILQQQDNWSPAGGYMPSDRNDHLLIRRNLMEWYFYAESIETELGEVAPSYGQISAVQYRYAPISVNVGYEYGSPETFEYQRSTVNYGSGNTQSGVPVPMVDTSRP